MEILPTLYHVCDHLFSIFFFILLFFFLFIYFSFWAATLPPVSHNCPYGLSPKQLLNSRLNSTTAHLFAPKEMQHALLKTVKSCQGIVSARTSTVNHQSRNVSSDGPRVTLKQAQLPRFLKGRRHIYFLRCSVAWQVPTLNPMSSFRIPFFILLLRNYITHSKRIKLCSKHHGPSIRVISSKCRNWGFPKSSK